MKIKVIIDDGIVRGVLKDSDADVCVELIDTSLCYEDHEEKEIYAEKLFGDPNYKACEYSVY